MSSEVRFIRNSRNSSYINEFCSYDILHCVSMLRTPSYQTSETVTTLNVKKGDVIQIHIQLPSNVAVYSI